MRPNQTACRPMRERARVEAWRSCWMLTREASDRTLSARCSSHVPKLWRAADLVRPGVIGSRRRVWAVRAEVVLPRRPEEGPGSQPGGAGREDHRARYVDRQMVTTAGRRLHEGG